MEATAADRASEGALAVCPGCGLVLAVGDGPAHPYIGASAACWALFGELLAREYGDPRYRRVHRTTVDAYAAQHPGVPERRTVQSVSVHLAGLLLVLDEGVPRSTSPLGRAGCTHSLPNGAGSSRRARRGSSRFAMSSARSAAEHEREVLRWAGAVWAAWEPHHATLRSWLAL